MRIYRSIALLMAMSLPGVSAGAVLNTLAPFLVNHYTFDNPLSADPLSAVELDLGSDATNIQLMNGAPRVADGAWWGSHLALETRQLNSEENDDWKAGVMFSSSAASTLVGTNRVTGASIMGWFKPLGDVASNPSPNTNTEDPNDYYNSFGLAGLLRGDSNVGSLDGHGVRALIEVINGKVTGLGRRLDNQTGSGQRSSLDNWQFVMPPNVWTHLTATFDFDHGTIDLYKNGLLLASSPANTSAWNVSSSVNRTSTSNAGGIKIGGSYPDNSQEFNPFNGRIDELMFFNKTLTASEVAAQFALISNIPGDFNIDGTVDAADFTLWRDRFGSPDSLPNDNTPGVQQDDYDRWKANFGRTSPSGAGAIGDSPPWVPEPSACLLAITALALVSNRRASQADRILPKIAFPSCFFAFFLTNRLPHRLLADSPKAS